MILITAMTIVIVIISTILPSLLSSLTDPNYLLNQGSNLDTSVERETKEPQPQSPFIKRILVVDDDPELTLTFKAGLDGYYYSGRKDLKYTRITILY